MIGRIDAYDVRGERVHVKGEKISAEEKTENGTKRCHAVHTADVQRRRLGSDVIVYVRCAEGEEGRTTAAEQQLGQNEEHHGTRCRWWSLNAILTAKIVVRC